MNFCRKLTLFLSFTKKKSRLRKQPRLFEKIIFEKKLLWCGKLRATEFFVKFIDTACGVHIRLFSSEKRV
jgi:hypothetical protein